MTRIFLPTVLLIVATVTAFGQLRLLSPNGGELFGETDTVFIQWAGVPPGTPVRLEFSIDPKRTIWPKIADSVTESSYMWVLGISNSPWYTIRVSTYGDLPQIDTCDGMFEVAPRRFSIPTFDFKKVVVGNVVDTVFKNAIVNVGKVPLTLTKVSFDGASDGTFEVEPISTPLAIPVGGAIDVHCTFRPPTVGRLTYNMDFELGPQLPYRKVEFFRGTGLAPIDTAPKMRLIQPKKDEWYGQNDTMRFIWDTYDPPNGVRIEYSIDSGATWSLVTDSASGYYYDWLIPKVASTDCFARILGRGGDLVRGDTTDGRWHIDAPAAIVYDHIDLPETTVGESSTSLSKLFIRNLSYAKLYVESFSIEGEHASEYEIVSGNAPFLLVSKQDQSVGFKFTPQGIGLRLADVIIASRDADTVRTELRGIGISETSDVPETGERPVLAAESTSLQMQPNPAQSDALIQYRLDNATRVRLTIYNSLGESVETLVEGEEGAGQHLVHIDVGGLASGIYIVVLETESGRQTRTVMIER